MNYKVIAAAVVVALAILAVVALTILDRVRPPVEIMPVDIIETEVIETGLDPAVIEYQENVFLDVDDDGDRDYVIDMSFIRDRGDQPVDEPVAQEPAAGPTPAPTP